jgi:WD40 repeat protein
MSKHYQKLLIILLAALAIPVENAVGLKSFSPADKSKIELKSLAAQQTAVEKAALEIQSTQNFKAHQLRGESLIQIHYSPSGKYLITSASDGLAKLWTNSGKPIRTFQSKPLAMLFNARFSNDGQMIITAGYDGTARLWSTSGQEIREFRGHRSAVSDAVFSTDGKQIITSSDDGSTKIWRLAGQPISTITRPGVTRNLAASLDGKLIATTQDLGVITLIRPAGKVVAEIETGQGRLNDVAFSTDGQRLVTAGFDGTARVWTTAGKSLAVLKVLSKGWVTGADFSPNGEWVATVSDDGELRLWNLSGKLLASFRPNQGRLSSISFHPDGKQLAATAYDGTVWLFKLTK